MFRLIAWSFVFCALSSSAFAVSGGGARETFDPRAREERDAMRGAERTDSAAARATSIGADADATARRAAQIRANEASHNSRLGHIIDSHQDASVRRAAQTVLELERNSEIASTPKYRELRSAIENGADFQTAINEAFGDKGVRSAEDFNSACP